MANVKISALPVASALAGTESVPIVQGGVTSKTTVADIALKSVAGSDAQVQYNNGGSLAADARFTFDDTNKVVKGQFTNDASGINAQTGTTYTMVAADNGRTVTFDNSSAITVTVPSGLGKGFSCICIRIGAGQVSIAAGSGVTINSANGQKLAAQHAAASLIAYVADTFNLSGYTSA